MDKRCHHGLLIEYACIDCRDENGDELATARAEIETLRAQVARLTHFTDADVERAHKAIQAKFQELFDSSKPPDEDPMCLARAALAAYVSREAE